MSSSDFRQIALKGDAGKAEKLFRAAVSAFAALTRPSRKEVVQLEDLALPLYDQVSVEGLRYVAAVLSECRRAPEKLVRRLADETVDIAAPVLIRTNALSDVDLLGLIARHGIGHARVIARRQNLNPSIRQLIRALEASAAHQHGADEAAAAPQPASQVDKARARLRGMMADGGERSHGGAVREAMLASPLPVFDRLCMTALTGTPALFQTALADMLEIAFAEARRLTAAHDYLPLMTVLRGLELAPEQAFILVAATYPSSFPHTEAIRLFVQRYTMTHPDAGRDEIRRLKGESIAAIVRRNPDAAPRDAAAPRPPSGGVKAS